MLLFFLDLYFCNKTFYNFWTYYFVLFSVYTECLEVSFVVYEPPY